MFQFDTAEPPAPDYADGILREAMVLATKGLDLAVLGSAAESVAEALKKHGKELQGRDLTKLSADALARSLNHAAKSLDVIVRLGEFAKGNPDSRPDLGASWLQGLTDEQFRQVEAWVRANAVAKETQELEAPR